MPNTLHPQIHPDPDVVPFVKILKDIMLSIHHQTQSIDKQFHPHFLQKREKKKEQILEIENII